ncbi:MAG TPA: hypothetical protein VKX25_02810 [Bryobacteraceae bacterium]|jgi:hypothetical protein|nr:hypothetical protein [Bryobacteraceae bacterium]
MANLFFPQLATGALAQYPIRKNIATRNIRNVLPDGSLVLFPDPEAGHIIWELAYQDLTAQEVSALTGLFTSCQGRFGSFIFIDPTDNMLQQSANLLASPWMASPGLSVRANALDPNGGTGAFVLTNNSQINAQLSQALYVPANYQYCLSVYASSQQATSMQITRTGPATAQASTVQLTNQWNRVTSSGALADTGPGITVSFGIPAGAQVTLFGPQLEAQPLPSRYRPTLSQSAIYTDAHWGVDALPVSAEAPNLYSTAFTIEAMTNPSS